jgi:hypothetical protein
MQAIEQTIKYKIRIVLKKIKAYGQLVLLDFVVANFTSVAYQRSGLLRPLKEYSSRGRFHA